MFKFIAEELAGGKKLALATVVLRSGSGPREAGAMMVLPEDGPARGTVGGGLLEAKTLEAARQVLADGRARLLSFDLNGNALSNDAMICGGRAEILIDRLDGHHPDHASVFKNLAQTLDSGNCAYLFTSILAQADGHVTTGRGLFSGDDFDVAGFAEPFQDADKMQESLQANGCVLLYDGETRCFFQWIKPSGRIFVAGAGHIGQALAAVCSIAGFDAVIVDSRPEYADPQRFPAAVKIKRIGDYADALQNLTLHASDAVVIATHSHLADRDVLAAALRSNAGYIGMIASRRKRDIIYASLREQGFSEEDLARVHSPAGLPIGAQTPAEIAVSIAAELIALRGREK